MRAFKIFLAFFFSLFTQVGYSQAKNISMYRRYYFNASGDDNNDGTIGHPFKTVSKFNSISLKAGDKIYFRGGQTFTGTILIDSSNPGRVNNDIEISSYGHGKATINSGNFGAVVLFKSKHIIITNLNIAGAGRKQGNSTDGIRLDSASNIQLNDVDVSGFQKSGLFIHASSSVRATHVYAHENGAAGIAVDGPYGIKESNYNIYIGYCKAEDNPGDPTNLTNHSGNGIVVGNCRKVMIEYCTATNNGWDMPRIGNGPVGIWAYEADSVTIQHCLSFRNKTSAGGADGGGFDLDGGVTNSVIQYCLSYENQGAGYSIFQYLYATPWYNNVYRFNISENDGSVSDSKAGAYIWNSSRDSNQFYNCLFYNNTVYNTKGTAVSYSELSERKNFSFFNNIFIAEDSLIKGLPGIDQFMGNDWFSLKRKFSVDGMHNFRKWVIHRGQEKQTGKTAGLNVRPDFKLPGHAKVTSATRLRNFFNYQLPGNSVLKKNGINLMKQYKINIGRTDFLSTDAQSRGIGACLN